MTNLHSKKGEQGFTLIELSIVLVIIGLIVGGILTGQDLIKSAEQRATLAQIEKYNTAINTFRGKYGAIPGDLSMTTASSFSLNPTVGAVTTGGGDGNGVLIDGAAAASDVGSFGGENMLFWTQLSVAGLVDGAFSMGASAAGLATSSGTTISAGSSTDPMSNWIPPAKLGRSNYIYAAGGANSLNYYILGGIGTITVATGAVAAGTNNLTPIEAFNMDKKVDDGFPVSGVVQATDLTAGALTAAAIAANTTAGLPTAPLAGATAGKCAATGSAAYLINATGGTTQACTLRFKFN